MFFFIECIDLNGHIESSIRHIQSVGGNIKQVVKNMLLPRKQNDTRFKLYFLQTLLTFHI